jgi:DNA processing protein
LSLDRRLEALVRLNAVPLFAPDNLKKLVARCSPEQALELDAPELARLMECTEASAARLRDGARAFDAPDYPAPLALLDDAPLVLYSMGDFTTPGAAAAVVGTRTPTSYGRRFARRLAHDLAGAGVCVVSGLARGIDAEAHEGALAAGGKTWAFLGTGLACVYPPENEPLARRIVDSGGCVASEYALTQGVVQASFLRRNRLIAGLGWATVVVEARRKSGALDTAEKGLRLGRDVFAAPGPADSPQSEGPLDLLKDGCAMVRRAQDVLDTLPSDARLAARCEGPGRSAAPKPGSLSLEYRKILQFVEGEARTADELAVGTGLDAPRLSHILFEMELQGLVSPVPGQRYAKKEI